MMSNHKKGTLFEFVWDSSNLGCFQENPIKYIGYVFIYDNIRLNFYIKPSVNHIMVEMMQVITNWDRTDYLSLDFNNAPIISLESKHRQAPVHHYTASLSEKKEGLWVHLTKRAYDESMQKYVSGVSVGIEEGEILNSFQYSLMKRISR